MADNSPLEKFLSAELLTLDKDWFCLSCNSCKETINNTSIIQSAPSWWPISSTLVLNVIRLSKITSFSRAFLKTFFRSESLTTTKFLSWTTTLWWLQSTIQAIWAMDTIGQLSKMLPQTNGSLVMIKLSLKLKLLISKHHMCSHLWKNNFFSLWCCFCARGISQFRHCLWVWQRQI